MRETANLMNLGVSFPNLTQRQLISSHHDTTTTAQPNYLCVYLPTTSQLDVPNSFIDIVLNVNEFGTYIRMPCPWIAVFVNVMTDTYRDRSKDMHKDDFIFIDSLRQLLRIYLKRDVRGFVCVGTTGCGSKGPYYDNHTVPTAGHTTLQYWFAGWPVL